jgi:hypothetical protein
MARTYTTILEYCGGDRTDRLHRQLGDWNPKHSISVLDNASPRNRCHCITHQNTTNSFIGGGIIDCVKLAEHHGAEYILLVMNDTVPCAPLHIDAFETILDARPEVVQISCALTKTSPITRIYPWMAWHAGWGVRPVPISDMVFSIFRLDFLRSFGGFPLSKGAWGYDRDLSYHALRQNKTILISDQHVVSHAPTGPPPVGTRAEKKREMLAIYEPRYPDFDATVGEVVRELQTRYGVRRSAESPRTSAQ